MGDDWTRRLNGVIDEARNPAEYRARAVDLLSLYGPALPTSRLVALSRDKSAEFRAKIAAVLGTRRQTAVQDTLLIMLRDKDSLVRTQALQALARIGAKPSWKAVAPLLTSSTATKRLGTAATSTTQSRNGRRLDPPPEWCDRRGTQSG